jgi:UDP-glucose 4-epimerase
MRTRSYLVTGGCGFIGSHLADRLIDLGYKVRILDNLSTGKRANAPAEAELVIGDVADEEVVRSVTRDVLGCFHLAAVASVEHSNKDPLGTNRVNLIGTLNVLRAASEMAALPVVYASSAAVYGSNLAVPLSEASETRPLSVYGADKLACELHARVATHLHGLPTVGFRLFNVYGTRQDPSSPYAGVISIFADRMRNNEAITLHGNGEQVRDFVYVGDVVDMFVAAMARHKAGAIVCNVCTGTGISIRKLAETLAQITETEIKVSFGPARPGDVAVSIGDPQLASTMFGVVPRTSLRDGLGRIFYRNQLTRAPSFKSIPAST